MITNNTKNTTIKYICLEQGMTQAILNGPYAWSPGYYFDVDTYAILKLGPFAAFVIQDLVYIFNHQELWDCVNANGQGVPMQSSSSPSEEDVQTVPRLAGSKSTTFMGETTSPDTLSGVLELVATAAKLRGVSFVSSASTVINESGLDVELKIRPYPVSLNRRSVMFDPSATEPMPETHSSQYDVTKAERKAVLQ